VGGRIGVEHSFAGKTRGKGPRPRAIARASGRGEGGGGGGGGAAGSVRSSRSSRGAPSSQVKRSRRRTELSRGRAIALDDINLSACAREVPAGVYVVSAALPRERDPAGSGSPHARTKVGEHPRVTTSRSC